jgi:hypothetical protein
MLALIVGSLPQQQQQQLPHGVSHFTCWAGLLSLQSKHLAGHKGCNKFEKKVLTLACNSSAMPRKAARQGSAIDWFCLCNCHAVVMQDQIQATPNTSNNPKHHAKPVPAYFTCAFLQAIF